MYAILSCIFLTTFQLGVLRAFKTKACKVCQVDKSEMPWVHKLHSKDFRSTAYNYEMSIYCHNCTKHVSSMIPCFTEQCKQVSNENHLLIVWSYETRLFIGCCSKYVNQHWSHLLQNRLKSTLGLITFHLILQRKMGAVHINHTFFYNFICTYPSGNCCFLLHCKHLGLECGSGNESCCFKAGTNETHGSAMTKGGCLMRKYLVQSVLCVWFSMCVQLYVQL